MLATAMLPLAVARPDRLGLARIPGHSVEAMAQAGHALGSQNQPPYSHCLPRCLRKWPLGSRS